MTNAPSWHEEARRLIEGGMTVAAVARAIGKGATTIRVGLNINGAQAKMLAAQREHRRRERETLSGIRERGEASKKYRDRNEHRSVAKAYADAPAKRPLTLPAISISALPDQPVRKYALPIRREEPSDGADRWRQIHRAMIRAGKLPEPGLPEQLHH